MVKAQEERLPGFMQGVLIIAHITGFDFRESYLEPKVQNMRSCRKPAKEANKAITLHASGVQVAVAGELSRPHAAAGAASRRSSLVAC